MSLKNVTVFGGGVLGTQIALQAAYSGFDVTIWLRSEASVGRTMPKVERYSSLMIADLEAAKGLIGNPMGAFLYPKGLISSWEGISAEKIDELIAKARENFANKLKLETDLEKAVADADIAIEAMAENTEQKIEFYELVKDKLPEKTILCTNSSTLLPSTFAEHTGRPEKYCALHFANTIWKNNTAEVMGHAGTSEDVFNQVAEFAAMIGMVPLKLYKEQPGYILNSMLVPFLSAAQMLWANGVSDVETIDLTWKLATSAPAGPFQILDIVGLDTAYNINQMKPDAAVEGSVTNRLGKLLKEKIDKGETGVNAGKGFYDYSK